MIEQCVRVIATAWLKSKETKAFLRHLTEERVRKMSRCAVARYRPEILIDDVDREVLTSK
jgi:hypothetical protein